MNRNRLALLAGAVVAAATAYACSGEDASSTTPPPVNGNDAGATTNPDGGPVTTPVDGGDATTSKPDGSADGGAVPACSSLPGTIVYIESGDTQQALLDTLGRQLRDKANITLVFQLTGSCTLTPNMYGTGSGPVPIPANTSMLYIPSTAENPSWAVGQPESTCTTGTSTPPPDLAISALFPSSCSTYAPPSNTNVAQYVGPTQAYTFIVPPAEFTNGQTSITNEEAYYAFGDGTTNPVTAGGAAEWNDPTQFFLRPSTKSTLVSTALNIHLTPKQMTDIGADGGTVDGRQLLASSTNVLSGVAGATSAQAIGILGDEVYDQNRSKVKVLAFQDILHGQNAAYFPDSTASAFDKQNIRDGHYSLWSPDVYMAPSTGGVANNPTVRYILDIVLGNPNPTLPDGGTPAIDGISITAGVGLTPSCAMFVGRTGDGAALTARVPPAPCTCKFLSAIPGATAGSLPASCTTCTTSADCADASGSLGCFNGYCETALTPLAQDGGACDDTTIENACTSAAAVVKTGIVYPTTDGGLLPVSQ